MNKIAFYTILLSLLTPGLTHTANNNNQRPKSPEQAPRTLTRHKGPGESLVSPTNHDRKPNKDLPKLSEIPFVAEKSNNSNND